MKLVLITCIFCAFLWPQKALQRPDLTKLEESVREQITSEQATFDAIVKDPRTSGAALS